MQSNGIFSQSILQRVGIRQLPGICWYPAKRTGRAVNQGGTADSVVLYLYLFVLDRVYISVKGVFVLYEAPLTWDISQRSFFKRRLQYAVDEILAVLLCAGYRI